MAMFESFHGRGLVAAALICAGLAGCGQTEATTAASSHASAFDLAFITNLYNLVETDRDLLGNELASKPDPRIAALASDLLSEANTVYATVQPIAAQDGIIWPDQATFESRSDLQTRLGSVLTTGSYDYDQQFFEDEIDLHKQVIQRAEQMAGEPNGDPKLRAISKKALAVLKTNLKRLQDLQGEMQAAAR